jgi:hypothetical protein
MRRRALALALAVALIGVLSACSTATQTDGANSPPASPAPSGAAAEQTARSGPVEVKVRLEDVTSQQVRFTVTLDNHERELTADPSATATLVVAGQSWPSGSWQVAESTGHHLSGTLQFRAPGAATTTGSLQLTLGAAQGGLPSTVTMTWQQ